MSMTVVLPEDLVYDLDMRVNAGEFASRSEAAAYFIRKGLQSGAPRERLPRPPIPPGRQEPDDLTPISVDPADVTWAERSRSRE